MEGNPRILPFSAVLHWIWEKNRDQHEFFIEESFPITWTYDYAIPCGLIYQISPTKVNAIPDEAVHRDFAYWHDYKTRLLSDPLFLDDLDARKSFCRLRFTIGNIYRHRKMNREAELAYKEALELWPADGGALQALMLTQWDRGEFAESLAYCEKALRKDPSNSGIRMLQQLGTQRSAVQGKIVSLTKRVQRNPKNKNSLQALIMLTASIGDQAKAGEFLLSGFQTFSDDPDFLRFAAAHYELNGQPLNSLAPAIRLVQLEPNNPANQFILAHSWYSHTNMPEFYKAMSAAIDAGGIPVQEMFANDSYFTPLRKEAEFRHLIEKSWAPQVP
jgi:tetratricopeptide (TPR) repeat protein